jgi:hypothetical protein
MMGRDESLAGHRDAAIWSAIYRLSLQTVGLERQVSEPETMLRSRTMRSGNNGEGSSMKVSFRGYKRAAT